MYFLAGVHLAVGLFGFLGFVVFESSVVRK